MPSINSSKVQNKLAELLADPEFEGLGVTLQEYGDYYVKWGKEAMDVKA